MFYLPSLDGIFDLLNLVAFGFGAVFLKIDTRVAGPRSFEDMVTAVDTGFSEVLTAQIHQLIEANIGRRVKKIPVLLHENIIAWVLLK